MASFEISTLSLHDALPISVHTLREDFGEIVEAEITEGSRLYHRPLEQLGLPRGIKIGAIVRHGQVIIPQPDTQLDIGDRKSTRLNSSHVAISYAVFCLKKK